jgi:thioredoxin-like negative regulator of GroEL
MNQSTAPEKVNGVNEIVDPDSISAYISGDKKTVVFFEMTGCPFCRAFQSAFHDFVAKRSGDCALLRVKLDKYDNPLWQKYEIAAVPTVIVFSAGVIKSRADAVPGLGLSRKKWADFCACF